MRRIFVILVLSVSLPVVAYSVIRTSSADPIATPIMSALAIAMIVFLVTFRWITADQAEKGLLISLYTLLPGVVSWCDKSNSRSVLFSLALILFSGGTYWVGPHSIHTFNVLTGDAAFIRVGETTEPAPDSGWLARSLWKPGRSYDSIASSITCLTSAHREWEPDYRDGLIECGEALEPSLISNGIDVSSIDGTITSGRRIRNGVDRIRTRLASELPERDVRDTILVAT